MYLKFSFFRLNKYESSIFFLKLILNRKKYILYFYIYNNFTRISKLKVSIIILNCMQENYFLKNKYSLINIDLQNVKIQ